MRVTSDFFASSLVRRVFGDGGFAAVERRGAEAAGAIFVLVRHRDGTLDLYGPAAQTHASDDGERRFMRETLTDETALEARFQREARFDPDFWVIEIETATPERYIEIANDL